MSQTPADRLVELLALERESDDAFVGQATGGGRRLFGGLVAAQAVMAAGHTVTDAELHSLHAYFLRPGRPEVPIGYAVSHTKEGRTFRVRSVLATQGEEIIFTLHASFARPEPGVTHQDQMPEAPPPEGLPDRDRLRGRTNWAEQPVEVRSCDPIDGTEPRLSFWIRAQDHGRGLSCDQDCGRRPRSSLSACRRWPARAITSGSSRSCSRTRTGRCSSWS